MAKKILITGASGCIGRNLYEQLAEHYTIAAPTSKELDLRNADEVSEYLKREHFDVVIHCAGYGATRLSGLKEKDILEGNLRMFFNLERCREKFRRMLYFGSAAEYDKRRNLASVSEDDFDTSVPIDAYGFSKYIMSKSITPSSNIYNLRLFGTFGRYEDAKVRFVPHAFMKALANLPITIRQNVFFDYLYIDDLVRIVRCLIEKENLRFNHYNVCTGETTDLISLAEKIKEVTQTKVPVEVALEGLANEYGGDNARLLEEIGPFEFTSKDHALRELRANYS